MQRAALLLPLVLATACAGATPAPQPPSGGAGQPGRNALVAEAAEAQVQAAQRPEAPAELAMVIRVANPRRSWGDATRLLATTPFGLMVMAAAQMGPDMLAEKAIGPALTDVIDLEQPVDVAFLDASGGAYAISIAVKEREEARLQERLVLKGDRGLLRVEGVRDADPEARALPMPCALDPGERRGSTRLVCAPQAEWLAVAPYLTEVVAREPLDVDARAEIRGPLLAKAIQEMESEKGQEEDRGARMGRELVQGFAREIEGMTVDLSWAGPGVELGLGLRLSGRRTPLSLSMAPVTKPDAAPPEAFFRLPGDAGFTFYTQGASRDELAPLRALLFEVILADEVDEGFDRAKVQAVLDRVGALILTGGPLVFAAGSERARVEKALAGYEDKKGDPKARESARRALGGWVLVGIEDAPGPWIDGLKEVIRMGAEIKAAPRKPGAAATKKEDERTEKVDWVVSRAPASLPAGTLHVELRSRPLMKGAPPPHTSHLYAAPAGGRLWIGAGEDDAVVIARLRAVVAPAGGGQAPAPEIAALHRPGSTAGGSLSMFGGAALFASGDTQDELDKAAQELGALGTLPSRGEAPIPWAITSEVLPGGAARWSFRVRLTDAAIRDAIVALTR